MTKEERAVLIFELRQAGIHPEWIRWFTRPGENNKNARFVLANPDYHNGTYKQPGRNNARVREWLKANPN